MTKNIIQGLIQARQAQIRPNNFFLKNMTLPVARYHDQLSSCTKSGETNDPIFRKLSDGGMDMQMDRQIVESDFIECCPANVKRPINEVTQQMRWQQSKLYTNKFTQIFLIKKFCRTLCTFFIFLCKLIIFELNAVSHKNLFL